METCEVLIVGGGPAGSSCAWRLRKAGVDALLIDKAVSPREKPCAGWITPDVLAALELDRETYSRGRVMQDIRGFRVGIVRGGEIVVPYESVVSYGIIRSQFDHFLLERSAVRFLPREPVTAIERHGDGWLVNGRISARMLVGAGGHFCPVARLLGAKMGEEEIIVAQSLEYPMDEGLERDCMIAADMPALFFCQDLKGYGWIFRKGRILNVGLGRMDRSGLRGWMQEFCAFLEERGYLPRCAAGRFQGHAYLVYSASGGRTRVADGALLIGDAAGLANPVSGEGILPAVKSGILAAETILAARGDYRVANLDPYLNKLAKHFGAGPVIPFTPFVSALLGPIGRIMISNRYFVRHFLLDRWFLHNGR